MEKYEIKIAALKKQYSVNSVIIFMGHDMRGYNAGLYYKKKKIAFVIQDGSGGPTSIQVIDSAEIQKLEAECLKIGKVPCDVCLLKYDYKITHFIEDLVNEYKNPAGLKEMQEWSLL